jgi:hypothetical protein
MLFQLQFTKNQQRRYTKKICPNKLEDLISVYNSYEKQTS